MGARSNTDGSVKLATILYLKRTCSSFQYSVVATNHCPRPCTAWRATIGTLTYDYGNGNVQLDQDFPECCPNHNLTGMFVKYIDLTRIARNRHPIEVWVDAIKELRRELGDGLNVFKRNYQHPLIPEHQECVRFDLIQLTPGTYEIDYKGGIVYTTPNESRKKSNCEFEIVGYSEPTWRAQYAGRFPVYSKPKSLNFNSSCIDWIERGDFKVQEQTVIIVMGSNHPGAVTGIYYCIPDSLLK